MKPTNEAFTALCFLVLMDHHGLGYREAHPNYIDEKHDMMSMAPKYAFGMLDYDNQRRVVEHLAKWGFEIPDEAAHSFNI